MAQAEEQKIPEVQIPISPINSPPIISKEIEETFSSTSINTSPHSSSFFEISLLYTPSSA